MKKAIAILCCLIMTLSIVALVGCGGGSEGEAPSADSPYIGSWKAVSAEFAGETADMDEVLDGKEFVLDLHEDGTAEVTSDEEGNTSEATWTVLENGIKLTGDDVDMEFEATEDGGLVSDLFGFKMYFEKQ